MSQDLTPEGVQGLQLPAATGTITASGNTVTLSNAGTAGNVTVTARVTGTNPVISLVFEISDDGTNWYAITVRNDATGAQEGGVNGVTVRATGSYQWDAGAESWSGVRVRCTAASGTALSAAVRINAGTYPFSPQVAAVIGAPIGATPTTVYLDQAAGIAVEALATLSIQRGDAAVTTGATYSPTVGKTFRLMAAHFNGAASGAAMVATKVRLRGLSSGTVTATGPIRLNTSLRFPTTTAAAGTGFQPVTLEAGVSGLLDVPSGGSLGVTHVAGAATYLLDVTLVGFEF